MNTKLTLTGVKEIDGVLKGLPLQINHRVMQAAHADAAKPLVERAKTLVPNGASRTFRTEKSIGVLKSSFAAAGSLGEITVGPRRGEYKGNAAHLIEYGTKARYTKKGAARGKMTAKPFMLPAWEATKDIVIGKINDAIGNKLFAFMKRTIKNA